MNEMLTSKGFNGINFTPAQFLVIGYLLVIISGTLLLMLPVSTIDGNGLGVVDAFFTATSATCVTGLIIVNTATHFTVFGQLLIMILIQIGGLGLMTMSTMIAFLIGKKISLKERLIIQEELNQFKISGMVRLVKYVLILTIIIEGIGFLLLFLRFSKDYSFIRSLYLGLFHSISAFNNAGFDLLGTSFEGYYGDVTINFVIIMLIILGGLGFGVRS